MADNYSLPHKISLEGMGKVGQLICITHQKQLSGSLGDVRQRTSTLFLARTLRQLEAIAGMVRIRHISDGWILHRAMAERFLLFHHLAKNNEFQAFDDFCFRELYESRNQVKSNALLNQKPEVKKMKPTLAERKRYASVKNCTWKRPVLEKVAHSIDMKFLHDTSYHFASGYVHPVSTDGERDLRVILMMPLTDTELEGDAQVLTRNSILFTGMHIQEFLNTSYFKWHRLFYDSIESFLNEMNTGDHSCLESMRSLIELAKSGNPLLIPRTNN